LKGNTRPAVRKLVEKDSDGGHSPLRPCCRKQLELNMKYLKAILAPAILFAAPAAAQDVMSDTRCLMVSNVFSKGAKDPKAKQVAGSALLFYGGRVSNLSSAQIQAAFAAQQKLVTPANAGSIMTACANSMQRSLQMLQNSASKLTPPKR
jgi:hypothetical protein